MTPAPRLTTLCFSAFAALALPSLANAAPVTNWTQTLGSNGTNLNTSSPVLGNGTAGAATNQQIYAIALATYTLAATGDKITFSGAVSFTGLASPNSDQFRFGLYDANVQTGSTGWLGYFATNSGGGGNPNGRLWERDAGNTTGYGSNGIGSATQLVQVAGTPSNGAFADGNYTFTLSATRTDSGLGISWALVGTSLTYSVSGTYSDDTPLTYSFNRVGFFTGGGLTNASQVSFSNIDLTFTPAAVPEPSSFALLAGVTGAAFAASRRRRR